MATPGSLLRGLRHAAGLSQRALAQRAGTSQPAIARYEGGASTPSWETLRRLVTACGRQLEISAEIRPDPDDVRLAETLIALRPEERLRALGRYARLRRAAEGE